MEKISEKYLIDNGFKKVSGFYFLYNPSDVVILKMYKRPDPFICIVSVCSLKNIFTVADLHPRYYTFIYTSHLWDFLRSKNIIFPFHSDSPPHPSA